MNQNHVFGNAGANSTVHAVSIRILMVWVTGLVFAGLPAIAAIGTFNEMLDHPNTVPVAAPIVCFVISVVIVVATKKIATGIKNRDIRRRKNTATFGR